MSSPSPAQGLKTLPQLLATRLVQCQSSGVRSTPVKADIGWRKSRLAARLLYRQAAGPLCPRDQRLAKLLRNDHQVTNRLIEQALYYLGGERKHALDRKLVEWGS